MEEESCKPAAVTTVATSAARFMGGMAAVDVLNGHHQRIRMGMDGAMDQLTNQGNCCHLVPHDPASTAALAIPSGSLGGWQVLNSIQHLVWGFPVPTIPCLSNLAPYFSS